jgi:hypothetical protein
LLKHGFDKHAEILTAREESVISSIYDRLVELSGLVVGALPDWFATSRNPYWIDVDETALEAQGEEGCLRQAPVLYTLLHPHVRKMYAACHVGKPFIVHAQTRHLSTDGKYWRTLYECALGLQYIHERGLVHRCWTDTAIQENVRDNGFVTGINLVHLHEADARQTQAPSCASGDETKVGVPSGADADALALSADVEAFGLKIFDLLTSDYYSTDDLSSTRLPDAQPPFLAVEEWNLLQAMCAESPSDRICIQEVVHAMDCLAKMQETPVNSSALDEYVDGIPRGRRAGRPGIAHTFEPTSTAPEVNRSQPSSVISRTFSTRWLHVKM